MTRHLITHHPGAIEWAGRQGLIIDKQIAQLGDVAIGILPLNLAANVCARGGHFFNLWLDMPPEARGRELSADELEWYRAQLEEYFIHFVAEMPYAA